MIVNPTNMAVLQEIKQGLLLEILEAFGHRLQRELVEATGLHQNEISQLRCGKLDGFSVDRLLLILITLGRRPVIEVRALVLS